VPATAAAAVPGRDRPGYRARLAEAGRLPVDDPAEAFQLLYGLVIQDLQIRVLLGEAPPPPTALAAQARTAVNRFLALTQIPAPGA
jgi:hypothetical protein